MADSKERLFADFTAPTRQEWRDKIEVDLKGADYEKKMVWRTNEGFSMQPFYLKEDVDILPTVNALPGEFPFVRGNKKADNKWYVRQNIVVNDPKEANAKALDILNKGVNSLGFRLGHTELSAEFIETLLDGICCDCVEVSFRTCQRHVLELADLLVAYFDKKGYDREKIVGGIGFDPIERMLMKGKDTTMLLPDMPKLVEKLKDFPGLRCVMVHSELLCNSGAYVYQELGYALAWGKEYLDEMVEAGVPVDLAAKKIKFYMGIGGNYFMEIAKFRAARMLWAQIVKQYEPKCDCACQMCINASTTTYNQTVFDSYVNMLRSQTEAMSAALAGIHSMVVTPFDAPYEVPTDFAERIARNQQLLLKEECHFDKIVDVSGGSYFVEELTVAIAKEGWKLFLAVEDEGGFLAAVKAGKIQEAINSTDAARHANAGKRKEFLLGTNQFPNFTETSEGKEPLTCDCTCKHSSDPDVPALKTSRVASDFEALRLTTEKAAKQPIAFMLTIGNLAMRQARAQFSCNFLAAAGYKVIDNLGFPTVEEGVEAAVKAGADIVVLCSSDDEYAEYGVPAFNALKAADPKAIFIIAGAPACTEDLKAAGIENFIHVRVDQLKTLKELNQKLGI
ncbi:MAG: methylmalonyl-CoA mutase small subunit [Bacteroidaceae bacterium]|nr:methylmalonyl-CoA mutase small subunit [Prevotella sp.]MBP5772087.1 methylmalonyl-CoA mutase small subunit [Bacteroidaceae bacterium]